MIDADLGYHETRCSVPEGFPGYVDVHLLSPTDADSTRLTDSGIAGGVSNPHATNRNRIERELQRIPNRDTIATDEVMLPMRQSVAAARRNIDPLLSHK
jgi:hypothetical protein